MQLGGIHHVTAISGDVSVNVAFYTQVLGLHLIKRSVNQDDVAAYHLFYGDEIGSPGTEMTFFDWPQAGPNHLGPGAISAIQYGVNGRPALQWWAERFAHFNVEHDDIATRGESEQAFLAFRDPEGQHFELVDADGKMHNQPWQASPVPQEMAIQGLYAVRLLESDLQASAQFLTDTLGFRQTSSYQSTEQTTVYVFEVGPGGVGAEVHVDVRPTMAEGRQGIGGVHHVAYRTPNEEEQVQWRNLLVPKVSQITPIIDRYYFHSVYFHEPGGVLFEIATDGPGFAVDEQPGHLGERLVLPPFLEPHRQEIEENLRPIIPFKLAALG
jgi:glyoxalase family protein